MALPHTFFRYFGGKFRAAKLYPLPQHKKIIEPFAGAAGYSCLYHDRQIELYDTYDVIHGIWSFLIRSSPEDILRLPVMRPDQRASDMKVCEEARNLIGFWCNSGTTAPCNFVSPWAKIKQDFWNEKIRARIAAMVGLVKHWKVFDKSYHYADNQKATWFIDPPYIAMGYLYVKNKIDYWHLGQWCGERKGQYIVCEQSPANWLPFEPFGKINSSKGKSNEVIYTNSFDGET